MGPRNSHSRPLDGGPGQQAEIVMAKRRKSGRELALAMLLGCLVTAPAAVEPWARPPGPGSTAFGVPR